ncbi:hypothetical protein ACFC63_27485 [Streptomyces albidoflavus]
MTAALHAMVAGGGVRPRLVPSPLASARGGALAVLFDLVERETHALWEA